MDVSSSSVNPNSTETMHEQLINKLADRLGTTADKLWAVLVEQAAVSAIANTTTLTVTGAILGLLAWRAKQVLNEGTYYERDKAIFGSLIVGLACLVWTICLLASVPDIVSGFVNPEYWALKQLLP